MEPKNYPINKNHRTRPKQSTRPNRNEQMQDQELGSFITNALGIGNERPSWPDR